MPDAGHVFLTLSGTRPVGPSSSRARFARLVAALFGALCALLAALALPSAARAQAGCDAVASTAGSDSAPGTESEPFRTVQHLANQLEQGQTGCVRAGTYREHLRVSRGGAEGSPVTLKSFPGERAKLVGRLHVAEGADHVTIADLDLDGRNPDELPSPTVNAAYTTFSGNDVTNGRTAICFNLGHRSYGQAVGTVIDSNRIHNCGKRPVTNQDHGIYVGWSDRVQITGNVIYDNADRGIQLYPEANRTTIRGNVIDGNGQGVIFSGEGGVASHNNLVEGNVISFSRIRHDVESWYPDGNPVGRGNVVRGNCIYGGRRGEIQSSPVGFATTGNRIANPGYVDREGKDFRLSTGSPCAGFLADTGSSILLGAGASAASQGSATSATTVALRVASRRQARSARIAILGQVRGRESAPPRRAAVQVRLPGRWRSVALSRVRANGRFTARLAGSTVRRRAGIRTTRRLTTWVRVRVAGGASRPLRARI